MSINSKPDMIRLALSNMYACKLDIGRVQEKVNSNNHQLHFHWPQAYYTILNKTDAKTQLKFVTSRLVMLPLVNFFGLYRVDYLHTFNIHILLNMYLSLLELYSRYHITFKYHNLTRFQYFRIKQLRWCEIQTGI